MDLKNTITQFILSIANNTDNTDNTDNADNNSLYNNVILNNKYYYNNVNSNVNNNVNNNLNNNVNNNTNTTNDVNDVNDENNLLYNYPLYDISDDDTIDDTIDDSTDIYNIYKIISEKHNTLGPTITNNYIYYNENDDINKELELYNYHTYKNVGNWNSAKILLTQSNNDKQLTHYLHDYLDIQFKNNNDCFDNISKVYYINNVDIDIIYEFNNTVAKHFVDNIKIQPYIPDGYIFSNSIDTNKWKFTITIITSKNIYTANRYITHTHIGFF